MNSRVSSESSTKRIIWDINPPLLTEIYKYLGKALFESMVLSLVEKLCSFAYKAKMRNKNTKEGK
jgi:hypothetical protein